MSSYWLVRTDEMDVEDPAPFVRRIYSIPMLKPYYAVELDDPHSEEFMCGIYGEDTWVMEGLYFLQYVGSTTNSCVYDRDVEYARTVTPALADARPDD